MRYFRILTLGDESDAEAVFVSKRPDGLDGWDFCMAQGTAIGDRYPTDAKVVLSDEYPGIKLTDFIGNSVCYLIASTAMKDAIASHANVEVEYLPLAIFNHRQRLHSADYWIVNPLGTVDCLDVERSSLKRGSETGEITLIEEYAFLTQRLQSPSPSILRVKETPWEYFVDEPTARAFHSLKLSNVQVEIVLCAP